MNIMNDLPGKLVFILFCFITTLLQAQENTSEVLKFSMKTKWSENINENNVWDVYPRPQLKRDNWVNLNGLWEYAIRDLSDEFPDQFDGNILVPFAIESELSRVKKMVGENKNLWYKREVKIGKLNTNERIHLNFGAVDWEAILYINKRFVGAHKGGFTSFSFDITDYLDKDVENEIMVKVWDPTDSDTQPRGKQSLTPNGIWYTPVTGIWQTVWLEKTNSNYIKQLKNTPNIDDSSLVVKVNTNKISEALTLEATIVDKNGNNVKKKSIPLSLGSTGSALEIEVPDAQLWSPENPHLYNLIIQLKNSKGELVDNVESYFGMRKISIGKDGNNYTRIFLNNKPFFQFGLLDQGWWPDGLYTAPSFEAMIWDVDKTLEMGFNVIRKHVKTEPASYYYECDKKGVLVWQDMPNGNYLNDLRIEAWDTEDAKRTSNSSFQFETELKEMMDQLHSFPSIVVWVPLNEGWGQYDTKRIADWVSSYDPSRLNDTPSGWADRGVGDLIDVHIYPGPGMEYSEENRASVIGEFGGLGLTVKDHLWWDKRNWGYLTYSSKSEFENRFEELINDLVALKSFGLSAAIYTQTTDVEGEVNGLITYDRKVVKMSPEKLNNIIQPLYKEANNVKVILEDSEHHPKSWMINDEGNDTKNWFLNIDEKGRWQEKKAPFASYDNFFLPKGSHWIAEKALKLYNVFDLNEVPQNISLRYYLDKAKMKVFINGNLIATEEFQGGRKRHYRIKFIEKAKKFLKKGKNIIAIELESSQKDSAFDIGIYSTSIQ
ncbi:MAG: hypothetical protein B7Z06_05285 [Flavobacteriales bacterium 32-35-8]|nr:MAG: hypothetical protein B7Z06_05285 [Flavobacteriales bacterium 32-35-8]